MSGPKTSAQRAKTTHHFSSATKKKKRERSDTPARLAYMAKKANRRDKEKRRKDRKRARGK